MADCNAETRLTLRDLVHEFEKGCKPESQFTVGAEHEKFAFRRPGLTAIPYDGPDGIEALLSGLTRFGWLPVVEGGKVIALVRDGAAVSLEPAGQFELSGATLPDIHASDAETRRHIEEVKAIGGELGIGFSGLGFTPTWRREDVHVMPKGRYAIMRRYMPLKGKLGLDMMLRTCTIQSNLDFSSEADMVLKFRTSLALQPVAVALMANSPFVEGKPTGLLSSRANVWTDTDPDRTGMLDFVFEDGFGFERYALYALDVPMYFVKRDGQYIDVAGRSFRDFIDGKLPELPNDCAGKKDWSDHCTTIFPEVRLKQFLEMRGADSGPVSRISGLQALWAGIFDDQAGLAAAWDLCKDWTVEEHNALRDGAARQGLKATIAGRSLQDVAKDMVAIAASGLKARARLNAAGEDERVYLSELAEIAETGVTPAERLLELFKAEWQGDASKAFEACAY
ncbi:MAG: glutamate--cysteine ligase [Alphaproteobacteria bacterium]